MTDDKLILIMESRMKWLKQQQMDRKNHDADFHKEIAGYVHQGKLEEQDILDLHNEEGFGPTHCMEISGYLVMNSKSGFTFNEARDIAQRIQPIYLSYHQDRGRTDGDNLFRESMKPYEDAIEAIYNGTYDSFKLKVLQSLPSIYDGWNHKLAIEAYPKIFLMPPFD